MRQHMDVSQERDDAVAARDAATLELRFLFWMELNLRMALMHWDRRRHKSNVSERSGDLQQQLHTCMRYYFILYVRYCSEVILHHLFSFTGTSTRSEKLWARPPLTLIPALISAISSPPL
jgi:hypothetical protein